MLISILFPVLSLAATIGSYQATRELVSLDAEGAHRTIAQHVLGFKDGRLVPAYIAFAQEGCTLSFSYGTPARIAQGERLRLVGDLQARTLSRESCLEWDSSTGDDLCVKQGPAVTDQILEGTLERVTNGEKAQLFCRVYEMSERHTVFHSWVRSAGDLLLSLE